MRLEEAAVIRAMRAAHAKTGEDRVGDHGAAASDEPA